MPKLGAATESNAIAVKAMGFSPINLNSLGASEYTLVDISVDDSSSVSGFLNEIRDCMRQIDFAVNAIKFVLTDGCENASTYGIDGVKTAAAAPMQSESVESCVKILVGIGTDAGTNQVLQDWKTNGGFDEFLAIKDASAKSLAKLAAFISKSISAQSQALGTGGPSKQISQLCAGITI